MDKVVIDVEHEKIGKSRVKTIFFNSGTFYFTTNCHRNEEGVIVMRKPWT